MKHSRAAPTGELRPLAPPAATGETRFRVRYSECDPMGVAHHASYFPWLEMGRTELLRTAGVSYADLEARGVFLVVARIEARFKAPARYDDELVLVTRVSGGGRAKIEHEYELWHDAGDGRGKTTLLMTGASTLACVDAGGRPGPLPAWLMVRGA